MSYAGIGVLRRVFWRIGRSLGGRRAAAVWDQQYAAGVWQEYKAGRDAKALALVDSMGTGLDIVEFGCGEGSLVFALQPGTCRSYRGFDISTVAVDRANARFQEAGLGECTASQINLADLDGLGACDVILAEECLYYLQRRALASLLEVSWSALRPGGVFIAVVHDSERHKWVLECVRSQAGKSGFRDVMLGSRAAVLIGKSGET